MIDVKKWLLIDCTPGNSGPSNLGIRNVLEPGNFLLRLSAMSFGGVGFANLAGRHFNIKPGSESLRPTFKMGFRSVSLRKHVEYSGN